MEMHSERVDASSRHPLVAKTALFFALRTWISPHVIALSLMFFVAHLLNAKHPDESLPPHALLRLGATPYCSPDGIHWCLRTADGKFFIVQTSESLLIIDAETGRPLRQTHVSEPLNFGDAALTPDNKHIVLTHGLAVDVRNLKHLDRERLVQSDKDVFPGFVSIAADGKSAAVSRANEVRILRLADGKTLLESKLRQCVGSYARLNSDGRSAAIWGVRQGENGIDKDLARQVEIWDVESGKLRFTISTAADLPSEVIFSPNGARIVTVGSHVLQIWDSNNGDMIHRAETDFDSTARVCFSRDGKKIALAGNEVKGAVFDVETGKLLERGAALTGTIDGIACDEDGVFRAWGHIGNVVALWEVPSGKLLIPIGRHPAGVAELQFSADGKKLHTVGFSSSHVLTWDAVTGAGPQQLKLEADTTGSLRDDPVIVFAAGADSIAIAGSQDQVTVHSGSDGSKRFHCEIAAGRLDRHMLFFSPDGRKLTALPHFAHSLSIWDAHSGKVVQTLSQLAPGCGWQAGALSADGKLLAIANSGPIPLSDIAFFSVDANKTIATAMIHTRAQSLVFLDERRLLAMGSRHGSLHHFDALTGKPLRAFEVNPDADLTGKLTLSPDGRLVAAGARATEGHEGRLPPRVLVWEIASGRLRHIFEGHVGQIEALAFSPDGTRLASGASDTTVLLWDLRGVPEKSVKSTAELWAELDLLDSRLAESAIRILVSRPEATVAFLKEHLHPVAKPDNGLIQNLLADLQADRFAVRDAAAKQLEKMGAPALSAIEAALRAKPNADFSERLEKLRAALSSIDPDEASWRQDLRPLRALEVLDRIGSEEARKALRMMASGADGVKPTRAARLTLERLK